MGLVKQTTEARHWWQEGKPCRPGQSIQIVSLFKNYIVSMRTPAYCGTSPHQMYRSVRFTQQRMHARMQAHAHARTSTDALVDAGTARGLYSYGLYRYGLYSYGL